MALGAPGNKRWLSLGKVAEYCLVSRATVLRWIKTGKLTAVRLPSGHYRINTSDLIDSLRQYNMPLSEDLREMSMAEEQSQSAVGRQQPREISDNER